MVTCEKCDRLTQASNQAQARIVAMMTRCENRQDFDDLTYILGKLATNRGEE